MKMSSTILDEKMTKFLITDRESEILYLIAHEYTTHMIAGKLFISRHTVISHRRKLLEKLQVKNVAGLVRKAFEVGQLRLQK